MIIHFSPHLRRFIELPDQTQSAKESLPEVIRDLDDRFTGLANYLVHENGSLRQHVNIFLDQRIVMDRQTLSDDLEGVKEIFFMQALSGG